MIEFVTGDFFDFDADIRINTVNCVGVMGAGVALAFKQKYPDMFKDYAKQCKNGLLRPGQPSVWKTGDMFSKQLEIINFPTKDHWRKPSEYEYVESGLKWLSEYLKQKNDVTVTLPALGCGHGGLDWMKVRKLIENYLDDSKNRILVFEPQSSKNAGKNERQSVNSQQELSQHGIRTISRNSSDYPPRLRQYTEKDIFVFGQQHFSDGFNISIISSSKPNEVELKAIQGLIEYCKINKLSILFGGSVSERKCAFKSSSCGVTSGVFLPSGIFNSAKKLSTSDSQGNLTLFSIGNPYESFDKKAYMPSVLSRIFMSDITIFTTERLEWVKKHSQALSTANTKYFYINYPWLPNREISAVQSLQAAGLELINDNIALDSIT
ncbi:hypothetical protein OAA_15205 [Vibrio cyclitrophicus 1F175]|uniref:macro domain-containing protein n=1 Tax=Vibrio cyclitrophicus TaxID=47951 RepID=UPI0002D56B75|nr:macro domain-containing protein [Vibrio cyclitrophicus]OEF34820.1 hypothetical protein OA7_10750 [Vibrio cyclitrophicus 1F53]OEF63213.1 hypothetical protein OAA_15205 [Vibrio cyclitrophicus 1F175]PMH30350.1 hypothetical protein BCU72_01680 [Vibrio cyclitrophicus]PMH80821.1 hypothetical protein BCU60_16825 [Vibrio cyclitrophicus]